ncbi:GNAT family N-acetyltransferase [Luteimicrobium sp. NPDC057192]|uniref:GNAT family N-acetyltransferase n=1 Tax=Luteimicrobium sp. NPDC057192 TaxID=3346042 RepID=UPI003634F209
MAELGSVEWPPTPIRTERLVLRAPAAQDRAVVIELHASPEVSAFIGGPQPRDELERLVPLVPRQRPGGFVVEFDGATIGVVSLERRDASYEIRPAAGKVDLGYLFLPSAWGKGYATEACAATLRWFADALPGEPVVLATQTANEAAVRLAVRLGFAEVKRLEAYGTEQWFGVWSAARP